VKKTSLYLEPELDAALAKRAEDEGLTKAEFIRRGLASLVQRPKRPRPVGAGVITGGPADLSERTDHHLHETGLGE
jgi:hypothetical protein